MKYLKMMFGLAAAVAALIAFAGAGSASATTLDCSSAGAMCAGPTKVHLVNEGKITLDAAIKLECEESTIEAELSTGGESSTETASGAVTAFTLQNCGGWTTTVVKKGTLEIHTDTTGVHDGNGTLTWSGMEFTMEGFGLHCIYGTENDDIGTITGSSKTGGTAVLHLNVKIRRLGGRSGAFCGGVTAEWTGTFKITTPMYLDVT